MPTPNPSNTTPPDPPLGSVYVIPPVTTTETPDVSYSTVPALPPPPNLATVGTNELQYLGYGCSITYHWNKGILPIPVAGSADSAAVQMIRTDTGYCVKTITAVATCIGTKPQMPSWRTNSTNDVLLDKLVGSFSPGKWADGTPIYGAIVQYVFALQQAPGDYDQLDMGASPFDLNGKAQNTLNPSDFVDYLVGPATPVTPPASGYPPLVG